MSMPSERLSALADLVSGHRVGDADPGITDVTHDSRLAGPGSLFVAVPGLVVDGHDFVEQAVARGASAIVCERNVETTIPYVIVDDARSAMAVLAAAVHGYPSKDLLVVGLTGTNGKTSVSFILESILQMAEIRTGLIGTVATRIGDDQIPTLRTTPESTDFQRLLREMSKRGAQAVVTEVSSHALRLGRVDETRFAVVGFTNLTQDHLDFHEDMEDYFAAKQLLFEPRFADVGVVCIDDEWGRRLANDTTIRVRTVSMERDADFTAEVTGRSLTGTQMTLTFPDAATRTLVMPLIGDFNVQNALVAAGCAWELGVSGEQIVRGLANAAAAPGRFELLSGDDPIRLIVDYAHTPDGIRSAIRTIRDLSDGRVLAVMGAGGDRDRSKRPLMGEAASGADVVIVTSDNPRTEDPDAIIEQVREGVTALDVATVADRRAAIELAVSLAKDGDAVLVLGKGHERTQEIGTRVLPFDDRLVSRAALAARRGQSQ